MSRRVRQRHVERRDSPVVPRNDLALGVRSKISVYAWLEGCDEAAAAFSGFLPCLIKRRRLRGCRKPEMRSWIRDLEVLCLGAIRLRPVPI
jgi:hypothetical protein